MRTLLFIIVVFVSFLLFIIIEIIYEKNYPLIIIKDVNAYNKINESNINILEIQD